MRRISALTLFIVLVIVFSSCGNTYDVVEVVEVDRDLTVTTFDELKIELQASNDPFIQAYEEVLNNGTTLWEVTVPYTGNFDVLENTLFFVEYGIFYNADKIIRFDRLDNPDGSSDFDVYFE